MKSHAKPFCGRRGGVSTNAKEINAQISAIPKNRTLGELRYEVSNEFKDFLIGTRTQLRSAARARKVSSGTISNAFL